MNDVNDIMVSICCSTYNHEKYISDAIESFLMQKTNFKFEILIHDDASTDSTPEIIKKYELKYPEIIKPLYQTENQYSKGIKVGQINRARAKGKYIAVCEGDDYWIDPYKLQKQVDYMEAHPGCSLCVHAAYRVSPSKKKLVKPIRPSKKSRIFKVEEIISGGGGLFATNSNMYRTILVRDMPEFYIKAPVGDYPMAIYLALLGEVYYMDEYMSAYRTNVPNSWTNRTMRDIKKKAEHVKKIVKMLEEIDEFSNFKYTEAIQRKILQDEINLMIEQGNFDFIVSEIYRDFYKNMKLRTKLKIFLKQHFPNTYETLSNTKRKILNDR